MRKILFITVFAFFSALLPVSAQHNMVFRYKGEGFYGNEVNATDSKFMVGGEYAFELPQFGKKNWHYTYKFPTIGFAVGYMKLMGTDSVSNIAYTYPYFLYPFVHTPRLAINLRLATGCGMYVDYKDNGRHQSYFPYVGVYSAGLTGDIFLATR